MADFVRFRTDDGYCPILVNTDAIVCVEPKFDGEDDHAVPTYSKTRTKLTLIGDEDNYYIIDEPFEDVCARLNKLW